jgi:hypothetical protein
MIGALREKFELLRARLQQSRTAWSRRADTVSARRGAAPRTYQFVLNSLYEAPIGFEAKGVAKFRCLSDIRNDLAGQSDHVASSVARPSCAQLPRPLGPPGQLGECRSGRQYRIDR